MPEKNPSAMRTVVVEDGVPCLNKTKKRRFISLTLFGVPEKFPEVRNGDVDKQNPTDEIGEDRKDDKAGKR